MSAPRKLGTKGRKGPRPAVVPPPQVDDELESPEPLLDDSDAPGSEMDAVQSVLSEAAGFSAAKVVVHRANKNESQRWLFTCDPESFNMELLRDKYGGGEFRLYISVDGRPYRNMRVSIEPPPKSAEPVATESPVLQVMREGFRQQSEQFAQLIQALAASRAPAAPAIDPVAMMGALISGIGKMREIAAPAPIAAPAESSAEKYIDILMKGMEMGRDMGGGDTGPLDLLRDVIKSPMLADAITAATAQPPARPPQPTPRIPPPRVNGAAHPVGAEASTPASSSEQPNEATEMLRLYLSQIISRAEAQSDPVLYADFILDNVPDEIVSQWIERPDLLKYLQSLDGRVAAHLPWFTALRDELLRAFSEPAELDAPPGAAPEP